MTETEKHLQTLLGEEAANVAVEDRLCEIVQPQPEGAGTTRSKPSPLMVAAVLVLVVGFGLFAGSLFGNDAPQPVATESAIPQIVTTGAPLTPSTTSASTEVLPGTAPPRVPPTTAEHLSSTTVFGLAATMEEIDVVVPDWLENRDGHSVVWTGTEVIVWGGWTDRESAGSTLTSGAYNPTTDTWRPMPDSPLTPRGGHEAAWTGTEMLIIGGEEPDTERGLSDGAAYNPTTNTWRQLPEVGAPDPAEQWWRYDSVWTGSDFVIWVHDTNEVRSYNPSTDKWRDLPQPMIGTTSWTSMLWTGTHIAAITGAGRQPLRVALFDPTNDTQWQSLPIPEFGGPGRPGDTFPTNSQVADGQIVVWSRAGSQELAFRLDLENARWVEIERPGVRACEGHDIPLSLGSRILAGDLCRGGAHLYLATEQTWTPIAVEGGPLPNLATAVWTGTEIISVGNCCPYSRDLEIIVTRYSLPD